MDAEAAGFWSYAHADDDDDGGAVLGLAKRLQSEFSLLTGEPLALFVDRKDLAWGQEWRRRIDDALAGTTFFIAIVTPRYFKSDECRRELLTFAGQAQSLGLEELLLPILYSEVPSMSPDSEDEAVALVARTQYVDWTASRLQEQSSAAYRAAVNGLAKRLVAIAREVADRQVREEVRVSSAGEEGDLIDLETVVEQITGLLPDWLEAVRGDQFVTAQHDAINRLHHERLYKLERSGAPASAKLAQITRYGVEELPLAERFDSLSKTYNRRTIELVPLVTSALRIVELHPSARPMLSQLEEAIEEALPAIRSHDARLERGDQSMRDWAQQYAHLSRVIRRVGQHYEAGHRQAKEANDIVLGSAEHLAALPSVA